MATKNAKTSGLKIKPAAAAPVIDDEDDDEQPLPAPTPADNEGADSIQPEEVAADKPTAEAAPSTEAIKGLGIGSIGAASSADVPRVAPSKIRIFTMHQDVDPAPRVGHYDLLQLGITKLAKGESYRLPQVVCEALLDRKLGSIAD